MVLVGFQNCGRYHALEDSNFVQSSSERLAISASLTLEEESSMSQISVPIYGAPNVLVRIEIPRYIEFARNSMMVDGTPVSPTWESESVGGRLSSGFGSLSILPPPAEEYFEFRYILDLKEGKVLLPNNKAAIYSLSDEEKAILSGIFQGAIIARTTDLKPMGEDVVCITLYSPGYARLQTDQAFYELGSNGGCSILDLFKVASQEPAGLDAFLASLRRTVDLNLGMEGEMMNDGAPVAQSWQDGARTISN